MEKERVVLEWKRVVRAGGGRERAGGMAAEGRAIGDREREETPSDRQDRSANRIIRKVFDSHDSQFSHMLLNLLLLLPRVGLEAVEDGEPAICCSARTLLWSGAFSR